MDKKQEHYTLSLFPIGQDVLDADFRALGEYDTDDIELLKTIWLDDSLDRNPSHELLTLALRPELASDDQIRRTYRAGTLVGTIIMRHRMQAIHADYSIVDLSHAPIVSLVDHSEQHEQFPTMPPDMKLSRFALNQFFDGQVDVAEYLKTTLEADWDQSHNTFQPSTTMGTPRNDWLAVGMGDTLALYGMLYALHTGQEAPRYRIKPLHDEPSIHLYHALR